MKTATLTIELNGKVLNTQILKDNRTFVINELTRVFKFESIELKDLMNALVKYTSDVTLTGDINQLKRMIDGLHTEYTIDNDYIVNSGTNFVAMDSQLELNKQKEQNIYNLTK